MKEIQLDKYQLEVVKASNNILVVAGPGSGKTTTILEKIKYLLKMTNEEEILVISFTNKSVEDIKLRLNNNVQVMTFHKLAIDILKYNNISYTICQDSFLDYLIDNFFEKLPSQKRKKISKKLNISKLCNSNSSYMALKKTTTSFIQNFKTNNYNYEKIYSVYEKIKNKFLLIVIIKLFSEYEQEKRSRGLYDFDDLIIEATNLIKKNYHYKKFKHIIVDEFQDTSMIRLNLIKTIHSSCHSSITAVGDDAQSIYRFSGCSLNIFLNFSNYFENSSILFLKNTYRNSQEIINITEGFINKNKWQIQKNMIGKITHVNPIIIIKYYNAIAAFKRIIISISKISADILVLGRNNDDIYNYMSDYQKIDDQHFKCHNVCFKYLTIHSAKGLESDYVIVLNVSNETTGIPCRIQNHEIIDCLLDKEEYPFAEERRVFFVALTRCRFKTYLLTPLFFQSVFIKELKPLIKGNRKI